MQNRVNKQSIVWTNILNKQISVKELEDLLEESVWGGGSASFTSVNLVPETRPSHIRQLYRTIEPSSKYLPYLDKAMINFLRFLEGCDSNNK